MIFLDTNFFLRFLTTPADDFSARAQKHASRLLEAIRAGTEEATTTELVIHEVCYVLTSKRQYGYAAADAIHIVRPLLSYRNLRLGPGGKDVVLRALEIWERHPKLEFADSAIAARCEINGWELATFDETLGSLPNVARWQPA